MSESLKQSAIYKYFGFTDFKIFDLLQLLARFEVKKWSNRKNKVTFTSPTRNFFEVKVALFLRFDHFLLHKKMDPFLAIFGSKYLALNKKPTFFYSSISKFHTKSLILGPEIKILTVGKFTTQLQRWTRKRRFSAVKSKILKIFKKNFAVGVDPLGTNQKS